MRRRVVRGVEGGAAGGRVYGYARAAAGLICCGWVRVDDVVVGRVDVIVDVGGGFELEEVEVVAVRRGAGAVGSICVNCRPLGVRRRCCCGCCG